MGYSPKIHDVHHRPVSAKMTRVFFVIVNLHTNKASGPKHSLYCGSMQYK